MSASLRSAILLHDMDGKHKCIVCAKDFPQQEITANKCKNCLSIFFERRRSLLREGYFENMKRMGSWKINGKRGKHEKAAVGASKN